MVRHTRWNNTTRPIILIAALLGHTSAMGYELDDADRWSRTATDGSGLSQGDATTVTWSILPEDPSGSNSSQLISFFDSLYPGGSGSDLTQRPWFFIFNDSFGRIEQLSGLTFMYEDDDDGVSLSGLFQRRGILDVRGDIRFRATSIDGQDGQNTLAQAVKPDHGDITIDTDNIDFFGSTTNDSRSARNVIMHELGHSLGLSHVESNSAAFLMEPFINSSFDGPQLDDILAIHRGYGDHYEKTNNGAGNETYANATPLGLLIDQSTTSRGTDANGTAVGRFDTDFVSIDDNSDTDFFSFTIDATAQIDLTLTPQGPAYNSGPQDGTQELFDAAAQSDLTLALFDTNGTSQLVLANNTGVDAVESIDGFLLETPGTYFVRITGSANAPQFYQLDVLTDYLTPIAGDLDGDFDVDPDDLAIVLTRFGQSVTPGSLPDGDPTSDGHVGIGDLDLVLANFNLAESISVPEPAAGALLVFGSFVFARRRRS